MGKCSSDSHVRRALAAAYTSFSYYGRYEVIPLIDVSFYPNWMGEKQKRFCKFERDELILSTPPVLLEGKQQSSNLTRNRM